jgi:hypothetical protein
MIKFIWELKSLDFTSSVPIATLILPLRQIQKIMTTSLRPEEQGTMNL